MFKKNSLKSFFALILKKYIASILNKFDWFPTLLYSDDINKVFIFKNVGVPINKKNKPADLQEQFEKILSDMKSVNAVSYTHQTLPTSSWV